MPQTYLSLARFTDICVLVHRIHNLGPACVLLGHHACCFAYLFQYWTPEHISKPVEFLWGEASYRQPAQEGAWKETQATRLWEYQLWLWCIDDNPITSLGMSGCMVYVCLCVSVLCITWCVGNETSEQFSWSHPLWRIQHSHPTVMVSEGLTSRHDCLAMHITPHWIGLSNTGLSNNKHQIINLPY